MNKSELSDEPWERLRPLLPPQKPHSGRPAKNHRAVHDGILRVRGKSNPWRSLPERFGSEKTVSSRFYCWQRAGVWAPSPRRVAAAGGPGR